MSKVRKDILSDYGALEIDVLEKRADKYSTFPYVTTVTWQNAVVYRHPEIHQESLDVFAEEISSKEVSDVFVATSIVGALIRERVERFKPRDLEDFYRQLASPGLLCHKIYQQIDEGKLDDKKGSVIIDSLQSYDMFSDVSRVNALRIASSLAIGDPALQSSFESSALNYLESSFEPNRVNSYKKFLDSVGRSEPLQAHKLCAGALPVAIVAFAMPMDFLETNRYLGMLK